MKKSKQLLNDTKETRGYQKLEQEALDHTLWRICFGRGYGPVIGETTECMCPRLDMGYTQFLIKYVLGVKLLGYAAHYLLLSSANS
jgi:hypothetical protein